ncbi:TPA: recombinase family protein [Escherichia coli]|nr:recombinase family protein [Escherichia coli]
MNCVLRVTTSAHNRGSRPGQNKRLRTLSVGGVLVVWKLNRLGRSMRHLAVLLEELCERGINFRALTLPIFAQQWGDESCKSKTISNLNVIVRFLCEQKIFIRNDYVNHFIFPTASMSKEKNTPVFPE